jgi:hypothetical protein
MNSDHDPHISFLRHPIHWLVDLWQRITKTGNWSWD